MEKFILLGAFIFVVGVVCGVAIMCIFLASKDEK